VGVKPFFLPPEHNLIHMFNGKTGNNETTPDCWLASAAVLGLFKEWRVSWATVLVVLSIQRPLKLLPLPPLGCCHSISQCTHM